MYHAGTFDKQRLQEITILNETAFHFDYLKHNYGSQRWKDSGSYNSWIVEREEFFKDKWKDSGSYNSSVVERKKFRGP